MGKFWRGRYAKYLSSAPRLLFADHRNGCGACNKYCSLSYRRLGLVEDKTSYPDITLAKSKDAWTAKSWLMSSSAIKLDRLLYICPGNPQSYGFNDGSSSGPN